MIDIYSGNIIIDGSYILHPHLSFKEFSLGNYFNNQNEKRLFNLNGLHQIQDKLFYVSLFFKESQLKQIHLVVHDDNITNPIDEPNRKIIHDSLLAKLGVIISGDFAWGRIASDYDKRSNISSIIVTYNEHF